MISSIFNFNKNIRKIRTLFSVRSVAFIIFIGLVVSLFGKLLFSGLSNIQQIIILGGIASIFALVIKALRRIFCLLFIAGILFIVLGEVYFRVSYFGMKGLLNYWQYLPVGFGHSLANLEYDDETFTGVKANSSGMLKGGYIEFNELGFRDKERAFVKQEDVLRIMLIGSSVSMGPGVDQGENYAALLDSEISEFLGRRAEVINLSRAGYRMRDYIRVLSEFGSKFNPDIYIIEDYGYRDRQPLSLEGNSRYNTIKTIMSHPGYLCFFIHALEREFIPYLKEMFYIKEWRNYYNRKKRGGAKTASKSEKKHQRERLIDDYYKKIKILTGEKEVFIVSLRPMRNLSESLEPLSDVKKACEKYGFRHINTYSENYGSKDKEMIIYVGDRHPNEEAHQIYANSILKSLATSMEITD